MKPFLTLQCQLNQPVLLLLFVGQLNGLSKSPDRNANDADDRLIQFNAFLLGQLRLHAKDEGRWRELTGASRISRPSNAGRRLPEKACGTPKILGSAEESW